MHVSYFLLHSRREIQIQFVEGEGCHGDLGGDAMGLPFWVEFL
jgi:hypothetical protein